MRPGTASRLRRGRGEQNRAIIPGTPTKSSGPGYVESGVPREEAGRHEPEARAMDGHHRPVLWPWDVVDPHRVPENDIAVDERAVRLDPPRQTIASTCLIHELAGRVLLRRVIGGDPEVRTEEAGSLQQGRVGEEKWRAVLSGLEDIGDGLAESVPGPGVHDLPEAARAEIETARRLALAPDRRLRHAGHRGRSWGTGGGIHFEHGIGRTVHVHVETEVEPVLMVHALDVRRHHPPVRGMVIIRALPSRHRLWQHDPDEQGLHLERPILMEDPVEAIFVVSLVGDPAENELAPAAALVGPRIVEVLPEQSAVTLVERNGAGYVVGAAVVVGDGGVVEGGVGRRVRARLQRVGVTAKIGLALIEGIAEGL